MTVSGYLGISGNWLWIMEVREVEMPGAPTYQVLCHSVLALESL